MTYKVDLMGDLNTSHSCESPVASMDLRCHISVTPAEASGADVLPATLHGCLALHLPTTVHRPTALL